VSKPLDVLLSAANSLDLPLSAEQGKRLLAYQQLIQKWNAAYNLVGTSNSEELLQKHLLDSLSVMSHIQHSPVLDVGSGAGIPGIPLAICKPELAITLLDSNGKKTRFMRQAVIELDLANVQVEQTRIEQYRPQTAPETIVCRAFAPTEKALKLLQPVVAEGGVIVVMLGQALKQLPTSPAFSEIISKQVNVPGLVSERNLLLAHKLRGI